MDSHQTQYEEYQEIESIRQEQSKKLYTLWFAAKKSLPFDKETLKMALFMMTYSNGVSDSINCEILADSMHHEGANFLPSTSSNAVETDIDLDDDVDEIFFEHIFPSIPKC